MDPVAKQNSPRIQNFGQPAALGGGAAQSVHRAAAPPGPGLAAPRAK